MVDKIRRGQIIFVEDEPKVVTWVDRIGLTCRNIYGHNVEEQEDTFYFDPSGELVDLVGDAHKFEY